MANLFQSFNNTVGNAVDAGLSKIAPFANDFQKAVQQNPEQYSPIVQWLQHYQQSQPAYFASNPVKKSQELYAQVGAFYGPAILKDPVIGKYYKGVFQNPKGQ